MRSGLLQRLNGFFFSHLACKTTSCKWLLHSPAHDVPDFQQVPTTPRMAHHPLGFLSFPRPGTPGDCTFRSSSPGQLSSTARQASILFLLHAHVHGRGHSSPSPCKGHGRPLWQCDLLLCTSSQRVKLSPYSDLQPLFNGHANAFTRNNVQLSRLHLLWSVSACLHTPGHHVKSLR